MKRFTKLIASSILIGTLLFGSVAQAAPIEPKIYLNGQEYQARQGETMILYQEEILLPSSIVNENSTIQWDKASNIVYIENKNVSIPSIPAGEIKQEQGQNQAVRMSEEAYKAKLIEILDNIEKTSSKYTDSLSNMGVEDAKKIIAVTKELIHETQPMYLELAQLNAPEIYIQEQIKIKEGAEVAVKMLNISLKLMEASVNSTQEAYQYLEEFESHEPEATQKIQILDDTLKAILGEAYIW